MRESSFHLPQRKGIRLNGFDYSNTGLYFVTICTQDKLPLFGKIEIIASSRAGLKPAPTMTLNEFGQIVQKQWLDLAKFNSTIKVDEFIVMPNHIHGIMQILPIGAGFKPARNRPLSEFIRQFKTFSSREINKRRSTLGEKIWQRNYYEHIIRDERSYNNIVEYIRKNPINWSDDRYFI